MGGKRYAVLVGNGSFTEAGKNAPHLPALRCPAADVTGLQDLLGQPTHGAYVVTTLIDRPHNEIRRALYDLLKKARPEDQVIIYYSGHGKLDEQGNLYLAGSDTDPESLDPTALAAADVQKYVGESRAGSRIVILDCCFSGAVERIFRHGTAKGEIAEQAGQALRAQGGQGVFYLTASTDVQTAEEKDQDHYSLLTKHIITGISGGAADANDDGEVRFSELCDFVQNAVRQEGAQRPLSFALKAYGDPLVALTGREPLAARREVIEHQVYALRAKNLLHGPDVARILDYIHGPSAELAVIQALHAACNDNAAFLRTLHRLPDRTGMPAAAAPDPAREPSAALNTRHFMRGSNHVLDPGPRPDAVGSQGSGRRIAAAESVTTKWRLDRRAVIVSLAMAASLVVGVVWMFKPPSETSARHLEPELVHPNGGGMTPHPVQPDAENMKDGAATPRNEAAPSLVQPSGPLITGGSTSLLKR
jgi:uncharacterized caspase-like protein